MHNFTLQVVPEKRQSRHILITIDERIYNISETLYHILTKKQTGVLSDDHIADTLNTQFATEAFTGNYVKDAVAKTTDKINSVKSKSTVHPQSYILFRRTIVPEKKAGKLYRLLSFLFIQKLFGVLCVGSIVATVCFFWQSDPYLILAIYSHASSYFSVSSLLMLYAIFLLIILAHETGHAAAASRFGITPKEIGIGLYFIYPVFYTNVTTIWKLPSNQRIIVNLGGIYFQLLINIILILLFYTTSLKSAFLLLVIINSASILSSLNPFFRFDGYWIFSDWFNLPNLRARSLGLLAKLVTGKIVGIPVSPALAVYTILNTLFWSSLGYYLIRFLAEQLSGLPDIISMEHPATYSNIIKLSIGIAGLLFAILLLFKSVYQTIKIFRHETR